MAEEMTGNNNDPNNQLLERISRANADLFRRVRSKGLEIEYSPEDDYLHVTIGEPRPSEAVSNAEGIDHMVLFDPESYEVTALEAPFFLEQLRNAGSEVGFWSYVATLIERSGPTIYIPPAEEGERAELALSKLLIS